MKELKENINEEIKVLKILLKKAKDVVSRQYLLGRITSFECVLEMMNK